MNILKWQFSFSNVSTWILDKQSRLSRPIEALIKTRMAMASAMHSRLGRLALIAFVVGLVQVNASQAQVIMTVAGGGLRDGHAATDAILSSPSGVAVDSSGNIYIADAGNGRIREVGPDGVIRTVAGNGAPGLDDSKIGNTGTAVRTSLASPSGVAVDAAGTFYIADQFHHRIRKVTPDGKIYVIAGTGVAGFSGDGGSSETAKLNRPSGIVVDGNGTVYFTDQGNNRVRKIAPNGIISTVAGNGTAGFSGDGGLAVNARISSPAGVALGVGGVLYFADRRNDRVRKVTPGGIISTLAGGGTTGLNGDGGLAINASLNNPNGIASDASGNVYIADSFHLTVRKVTPTGMISRVAGTGDAFDRGGNVATDVALDLPGGLTIDSQGNIYITENVDNQVWKLSPDGLMLRVAGNKNLRSIGDGGPATEASLNRTEAIAFGADGTVYISDQAYAGYSTNGGIIRAVGANGVIRAIAGPGAFGRSGDGGPATSASFFSINSIVFDAEGNIYALDSGNGNIRKIDRAGIISTVETKEIIGSDEISSPSAVIGARDMAIDVDGNIYVADGFNRIRKISSDGIIRTVAGNGTDTSSGDGGPAIDAGISNPEGIAVDADGALYIAETYGNRIRKIDPNGIIYTIAGTGSEGFSGDGGVATKARLLWPSDVAIGSNGRLFIADSGNYCIRMIAPDGTISTVAGSGPGGGFGGDGARAVNTNIGTLKSIAIDTRGEIYFSNYDQRIRKVTTIAPGAPFLIASVPGDTQATVTIIPPLSDGGSTITGYTVTSNPAGGIDSNAGSTGLVHVITGLANDTAYTFTARATNAAGTGPVSDATSAVTPRSVVLTIDDVTVDEGSSGQTQVIFTISLSKPAPAGGVTFDISTADQSANAGVDYGEHRLSTETIPEGQSSMTLTVPIFGDTQVELNETFAVNISNVLNAAGADLQAIGTIRNDDIALAPPIAKADTYRAASNQSLDIGASAGVLSNDSDPSHTKLRAVLLTAPMQGTIALQPDGAFSYAPNQDFSGTDSFTYRACNLVNACADAKATLIVEDISLAKSDRYLWLVPPASNTLQQGVLRLVNRENRAGEVTLQGLDASGNRSSGTITLTLSPHESRQINSQDLEFGNAAKELVGNLGDGAGDWTVVVHSDLDLEPLAYIRTPDGFLTSVHDRVAGDGVDWLVPMFNPADNPNQSSHLRIINTSPVPVSLQIRGVDDAGNLSTGMVTLTLAALASADLNSEDLERGNPGKGLIGQLGDGQGKWQLKVSATDRVTVQSLLFDPKGYLTNLSTLPDLSESVPGERTLWLVPPASNLQQQGFVRVTNRENRAGDVALWGIDDAGNRSSGTITFTLNANESRQFNAQDLEAGNPAKGLTGHLGAGVGSWRLVVLSDLDVAPMALVRTPDGFLTSMHDTVAGDGLNLHIPMFNPAENANQVSLLRLVNPNATAVGVTIHGVDDAGHAGSGGDVTLTMAASTAIELSAADLEQGNAALALNGKLGDGAGKWALTVTATAPVKVMNLLRDPKGYLTNLSGSTIDGSGKLDP